MSPSLYLYSAASSEFNSIHEIRCPSLAAKKPVEPNDWTARLKLFIGVILKPEA